MENKTFNVLYFRYEQRNSVQSRYDIISFFLTHSTHFIYGVGYMVKPGSLIMRDEICFQHYMGCCFYVSSKGFYMHLPTDRITHTMALVIPIVEHWLERDWFFGFLYLILYVPCIYHIQYYLFNNLSHTKYVVFHIVTVNVKDSTYHGLCYASREALIYLTN